MKYPAILLAVAAVMLLVGLGIRMHADGKYMDKMYYHTWQSTLYSFHDVFTERKIGNAIQFLSVIAAGAGCVWFVVVAIRRDKRRQT